MSRMSWDSFKKTSEYQLWEDLFRVAKEYGINEDTYFKKTDFSGEYWEPFFDRLYKMGSMLGFTKKLKEIRIDWMRPILYFGAQSTGVIEFDGRRDEVNKGAISNAILVKFSFKSVINAIHNFANLNDKNFHKEYIQFKKDIKYYFLQLSKFVKDGFLTMHNHVKLILKPLLDLRRGAYRLFALEQMEKNNRHLTMFQDTKDLSMFLSSTREFFEYERYKQSKDPEGEKLNEFINGNTSQSRLIYEFSSDIRKNENNGPLNPYATNAAFLKDMDSKENKRYKNQPTDNKKNNLVLPKIKKKKEKNVDEKNYRLVLFPNIDNINQPQPTQLKHQAYQILFENGLNSMIDYLNSHQNKDFPYIIDSHKIFVNIKYVPNGTKEPATSFYINKLLEHIEKLKEKCYEMKLNGLSRVLMPITENVDLIKIIKNVFDYHVIIDNVMGNFLLYEQYMFIYNQIKFLLNSSKKEQIEQIKDRYFMEEAIPKYVFFQSLCHSVKVLEKFKKYYKYEKGRIFQHKDSYQLTLHDLDNEDNELIFAYEIYGPYKRFFVKDLQDRKKQYDNEVAQFGRFFLMEGFFNKADKNLWIEAVEALSYINELVREDIRDKILNETEESKNEKENENERLSNRNLNYDSMNNDNISNISYKRKDSSSSSLSSRIYVRKNSKIKMNLSRKSIHRKTKDRNMLISKKSIVRQQSTNNIDFSKINLDLLRPPKVWNYPIFRLRKLKIEKSPDVKLAVTNIRNVEPSKCYVDGRVQRFNKLFEQLYKNMQQYWNTGKKADTWDYFYDKVLKALNIKYEADKLLKREKLKKAMEEEEKKKKEEEENKSQEEEKKVEEKKVEEKKDEEKKDEEKNEQKSIMKEDDNSTVEPIDSRRVNNFIINSENTITSNGLNSNNSQVLIKKLKIKQSDQKRNKKDEIITNETSVQ